MCRSSTRGRGWLHIFGPFTAALLLLGSLLVLLPQAKASTVPAPTQVPAGFYGLNAQTLFRLPPAQWDAQLDKLEATGVSTVRFGTGWNRVEPNPPSAGVHTYSWTRIDQIVEELAKHNLQGLPIVDFSAKWASSDPTAAKSETYPPSDPTMFADFARALAARYGPGGAFWASKPSLATYPISQYEIWNEENWDFFFRGADPTVYAPLYAAARAAIHGVIPGATVMVGGLVPTADVASWLHGFIATLPARGQEIDAIGWHPYYTTAAEVYASLRGLHAELAANGLDPAIDLTEVNSPSAEGQSALLSELARTLPRSDCHVTSMTVHTWTALPEDGTVPFAIADNSGNLNPSGVAFSTAIQSAETEGVAAPAPICAPVPPAIAPAAAPAPVVRRQVPSIQARRVFRHGQTLRLGLRRPRRGGAA